MAYAVDGEQVHPAVGLREVALAQGHLPYAVVNLEARARRQYDVAALVCNLVGEFLARFAEFYLVVAVGADYGQYGLCLRGGCKHA